VYSYDSASRFEAYLSWLVETQLSHPNRIVDVGCGVGINTCFYGRHFRGAEVVGIDRCEASLACAREFATRLGVDNVRFEHADVLDMPGHWRGQQFGLVTSTFVAQDLWDPARKTARSVEEVMAEPKCPELAGYAEALSSLLEDRSGTLITFERSSGPIILGRWSRALRDAGIGLDLRRSSLLSFHEVIGGLPCQVPVLLGSKVYGGTMDANELRTWLMRQSLDYHGGYDLNCEIAEAVFAALRPTDFVKGLRYRMVGGFGETRCEVWRHGPLAVAYRYGGGHPRLIVVSRHEIHDLLREMDPRDAPHVPAPAFEYVKEYDSPETADRDDDPDASLFEEDVEIA
jgi:SAM-dependent methyltransferase